MTLLIDRTDEHAWDPRVAFTLLGPDSVLAGQVPGLIGMLRSAGYRIVSGQLVGLTERGMRQVYREADESAGPGRPDGIAAEAWRALDKLYRLSPALLLVLRGASQETFHDLTIVKGHKRPECADADSLRFDAESVLLNYVHVPDDPIAARRELRLLVGEADAAAHLRLAGDPPAHPVLDWTDRTALERILPVFSGRTAISLPFVVNRIRWRILTTLARRRVGRPDLDPTLDGLAHELIAEIEELRATPTSRDRLIVARRYSTSLSERLTRVAREIGQPTLVAGIEALDMLFALTAGRPVEPVLDLAQHGVHLAPAELMAVTTHHVSFRPNKYLTPIFGS